MCSRVYSLVCSFDFCCMLSSVRLLHRSLSVVVDPHVPALLMTHVTDKTATAVQTDGPSLCVVKPHHGGGPWFVNQECWCSSVWKRTSTSDSGGKAQSSVTTDLGSRSMQIARTSRRTPEMGRIGPPIRKQQTEWNDDNSSG